MPSTYAHYRLGRQVLNLLPKAQRGIIAKNPELFLIGLHGPDILFYYRPIISCEINRMGYEIHGKAGREFFSNAADIIKKSSAYDRHLSYIYGVICHFALDVCCHGYVNERAAQSGISHSEIEVEFDRYLMKHDGFNPLKYIPTDHINTDEKYAEIIGDFYKGTSRRDITEALKSMKLLHKILAAPKPLKTELILSLLRLTGNYEKMHGAVMNLRPNYYCRESNKKLCSLYKKGVLLAAELVGAFDGFLSGKPLHEIYDFNFSSEFAGGEDLWKS